MADNVTKPSADEGTIAPTSGGGSVSTRNDLRREVERLFEAVFSGNWPSAFGRASSPEINWPRREGWLVAPAMDLAEKPGAYEISAELPGLDEKDVQITLMNGNLVIKGEKKEEKEQHEKEYHVCERRFGSFQRAFRVPDGVDVDRIDAQVRNGVLKVTLPKSPAAQQNGKKIDIKAG